MRDYSVVFLSLFFMALSSGFCWLTYFAALRAPQTPETKGGLLFLRTGAVLTSIGFTFVHWTLRLWKEGKLHPYSVLFPWAIFALVYALISGIIHSQKASPRSSAYIALDIGVILLNAYLLLGPL